MVAGPLVSMVKEKASSYLLEQYKVMEGMEEQHEILKRKLPAILDVIADAEEQAAKHRQGVKAWLEALRKVAYEANDFFDEFKYEALHRKAKGHYKKLGIGVIKLIPTHNRVMFHYKMGNKLSKIVNAIEVLIAEMNAFRFEFRPEPPMSLKWRKTDSRISGHSMDIANRSRAEDKQKIVNKLLAQASNVDLTVIPIVGMGGMGKTTLAQLIYNDPEIQKHFQLLLWLCVSDNFDVDFLVKNIVEEVRKAKNDDKRTKNSLPKSKVEATPKEKNDGDNKILPQDELKEVVGGQRYLLVLDDVWNREAIKWEGLKSYLQHGGSGSSVLTTTRDQSIAQLMAPTQEAYNLKSLNESFIKEIIERRAFSPQQERPPELLEMDYEIDVEMLIQLWMANGFIPEQQGECPEIIGKRIFSELVSRSFFEDVKGIPFEFHHIKYRKVTCKIHDLMHDVAQSSMGKESAAISRKLSKTEDFPYSARHLYLSGYRPEAVLNASLEKEYTGIQTLICTPQDEKGLVRDRSINKDLQNLSKCRSVRALKIQGGSFLKPKYLHHLRYLDLSASKIKALPEDISILYHLQTLNLSQCNYLCRLPKGTKYMTALHHLYTHGCSRLESMPPDLGHLICLPMLTNFVAGTCSGCSDLGELRQLDLGGRLELRQLGNVTKADAKAANLGKKEKLTELTLGWTDHYDETENNHKEVLEGLRLHERLKVLRIYHCGSSTCPTWMNKLQYMVKLQLYGCKNLEKLPPLWQLPALEVLRLYKLDGLNCLFDSGTHTPFTFCRLKELALSSMKNFETWWDINKVQGEEPIFPWVEKLLIKSCHKLTTLPKASNTILESPGRIITVCRSAFPALKEMKLDGLRIFQRWEAIDKTPREEVIFPQLDELAISRCPKLTTLPEAPKMTDLSIDKGSEQISLQAASRYITSLLSLCLDFSTDDDTETTDDDTENLSELLHENEKWNHKSPLELMNLDGCNLLFTHPSTPVLWTCFSQLLDLKIYRIDVLYSWPEKVFQGLVSLRRLYIDECRNLSGHTEACEQSTPARSELLPRLESLEIIYCEYFIEVPNLPASLKLLKISYCHGLKSIFSQPHDTRLVSAESVTQPDRSSLTSGSSYDANDCVLPHIESLTIEWCGGLEVLHLPPSIKRLGIYDCEKLHSISGKLDEVQALTISSCLSLKSLESCFGEVPSLQHLALFRCFSLESLPKEPQAYSSLRFLKIRYCNGIKLLPLSLQQRLDYLEEKELDACYEGNITCSFFVLL
uniref:Uncharacterized protein n=1 Tax=Leersia perrieri TaxID=77586 RepID=A0A0D9W1D6_9ORYZ